MADTTKPSVNSKLSGKALEEQVAKEEAVVKEAEAQASKITAPPATTEPEPSNPTTNNSGYKLTKNNLTLNGTEYTGEYNGKFYNQGKVQTDAQVKAAFLANYAEQARFIQSVPELSDLLSQAISNNWSKDQWNAAFTNTQWAQAHPGDIGTAEIKRISDPKQYNIEYNAQQNRLATLANQLGVKLTPQQLGQQINPDQMENPTASNIDQKAIDNGQDIVNWMLQNPTASDQAVQQRLAKYGAIDPNAAGGTIFQTAQQLAQTAKNYGVSGYYNQQNLNQYALNIAAGTQGYDVNTFEAQQKQLAMQLYKPFADQIAAGANVAQLATPYVNTLTNLLEIDPSTVDLGSQTGYGAMIGKAMMGDGETATNPYDFAAQVRSRPEWLNTQNAHQTIMGGVDQLLSAFNFKGA
jgi:hypothetical protein